MIRPVHGLLAASLLVGLGLGRAPQCNCPPITGGSAYGPQASITCPAGSVLVSGGSTALQTAISANIGATTFCLTNAVHVWTGSVAPKSGNTFVGQLGAVL